MKIFLSSLLICAAVTCYADVAPTPDNGCGVRGYIHNTHGPIGHCPEDTGLIRDSACDKDAACHVACNQKTVEAHC